MDNSQSLEDAQAGYTSKNTVFNRGSHQKKLGKLGKLGLTPLPRSGQENVKKSRQVVIFGVILPFHKGKKWVKTFTNRSGQAGGG